MAAVILAAQGIFFLLAATYLVIQVDWEQELADVTLSVTALRSSASSLLLAPSGLLLLLAAILVFVRPRTGWVLAMILQCIILFITLQVYFVDDSEQVIYRWLLYLIMLGAILVVIYFNAPEGRLLLARRPVLEQQDDDGTG